MSAPQNIITRKANKLASASYLCNLLSQTMFLFFLSFFLANANKIPKQPGETKLPKAGSTGFRHELLFFR